MAHSRRKSHKISLFALVLLALFAFELWQSNRLLVTEEFALHSASLPSEFDGFRIVQLSDLHGAVFGDNNEKLLSAVAAAQPDMIAITGDLIDENTEQSEIYAASLGTALSKIAPTYYVTGNHEWGCGTQVAAAIKSQLSECGVTVLSNEYVTLSRGEEKIVVAGMDDPNGFADQKTPEMLRAEVLFSEGDCFSLLLAHRDTAEYYNDLGFSLTLCGHGHGGIFRIPIVDRGLLGTNRRFFPAYDGGLYEFSDGNVCFVSRGLGNIRRSFRAFNRPQVAVITLGRS